ncbi:Legumin A [Hibiscus syriacus]|uniref:Legumin A n=1 Tax=Hibiscus syriacus TaxID=106335 RepID=A0A6A2YH44_HIBSY|nr:legumin A-like [Hibiscus syriacus]KAE8676859.1 Legumin A [Hibiscus syriacus]
MANNPSLLSLSLSLLLLFNGCLAHPSSEQQFQSQNECQINRLNSIEPTSRIRSEAGTTEWWNPNSQQLSCAGVSVLRQNVEPNGLILPSFTNAPQLVYIVQGRGIQGTVIPGCAETFQESQQGQGQKSPRRLQDQHQKIRRFRRGDVIALPAGVVHWFYNDGNERLVTVNLLHTANSANQLDDNPRRFHLAGNPEEEQRRLRRFAQQKMQGSRSEREEMEEDEDEEQDNPSRSRRESPHSREQQSSSCNNLLCAFDSEFLAQAFNVDTSLIRRLQEVRGNKGSIIRVKDRLDVVSPPRMEEEEREERQEEERRRERQRGGRDNGLEETFCAMRMKENIADPERADIFNPQAGRISTLNGYNLPILQALGLSAERGVLYNRAGTVPQWCINAHKILYMLRGRARIQVVNQNGDTVFDDNVEQGQLLTVPQNFAFMKRAGSEGAEWVSFFTNSQATNTPMAGRVSAIRALPEEVVAASYQISKEDARKVKFNNQDTYFFTSSRSERRDEA